MFGFNDAARTDKATLQALGRSLAIIEFDPTGKILSANENFCKAIGLPGVGNHRPAPQHVRRAGLRPLAEYREFWTKLGRGEFDAREYKRLGKGGRNVWIQASYNPVIDSKGKVLKVVKVATDITAAKLRNAEFESKFNAISLAQAVIEFTPAGEIITANENFLRPARIPARGNQRPASSDVRRAGLCGSRRNISRSGETERRRIYRGRLQAYRQGRQGGLHPSVLQPDFRPRTAR